MLKGYTCVVAWVVAAVAGGVATILGIVVGFCQASWGSGEMGDNGAWKSGECGWFLPGVLGGGEIGDNGARQQASFLLWVSA